MTSPDNPNDTERLAANLALFQQVQASFFDDEDLAEIRQDPNATFELSAVMKGTDGKVDLFAFYVGNPAVSTAPLAKDIPQAIRDSVFIICLHYFREGVMVTTRYAQLPVDFLDSSGRNLYALQTYFISSKGHAF